MAVKAFTSSGQNLVGSTLTFTWASMQNGDTGSPVAITDALGPWLAACNAGTFGTGGNLQFQGSVDGGTTWFALTVGPEGTAATTVNFTNTGLRLVKERPLLVRPAVTAGDGTTSLTAVLVVRR